MYDGLIESAAATPRHGRPRERRIHGIALAQVIDHVDQTNEARVQLKLPWLPGFQPWARVATLMAGPQRGTYFVPQTGDEVVVAFNNGDVRDPYVLGVLWNGKDRPPSRAGRDAGSRRLIRTPAGHELTFDDDAGSITIANPGKQTVTLGKDSITIAAANDAAKLTLGADGSARLEAKTSVTIEAESVTVHGKKTATMTGDTSATVDGKSTCVIHGGTVAIN